MHKTINTLEDVQHYYGEVLQSKNDLQTNACCTGDSLRPSVKSILSNVEDEILTRFYGCGSPIPEALEGCTVLDLGCGTGRDVYVASKLVGENGKVIGIDMTDAQLEVANKYIDAQTKRFGFKKPNVTFKKGYIEDLATAGIEDNSVDVVISNCVINLSPNKEQVFKEIFRVLKPGGELYFSDVFSDRRIPLALTLDPVLRGECLSGALYVEDFRRMLTNLGCPDHRVVENRILEINNPEIEKKIGNITFFSTTIRAFKLASLEDQCEDFGQIAIYKGTIEEFPHDFSLDNQHLFQTGKPELVCGNTAAMLEETRFAKHFEIIGDRSKHYGLFDCGSGVGAVLSEAPSSGSCC